MDKQQVIDAIKKNAVSIIAGVVALIAVGVMVFWINGQYASLKAQTEARKAKAGVITSLLAQPRPTIQTSPGGTREDAKNLTVFPTPVVIKNGTEAMDQVKQQSSRLLQRAVDLQASRFVPLRQPDLETAKKNWPLEGDRKRIPRDQFRREYADRINADNRLVDGDFPAGSLQHAVQATVPPTAEDIASRQDALDGQLRAKAPTVGNQLANPEGFAEQLAEEKLKLEKQLKYERARSHLLYLDLNNAGSGLTVHPIAAARDNPTAAECFDAQIGLWVQETVALNLLRANQEALAGRPPEQRNVTYAPVKHLMWINVPDGLTSQARIADAPAAGGEGAGGGVPSGAGFSNPYGGGGPGAGYNPYNPYGGGPPGAGPGATPPAPPPAGLTGGASGGDIGGAAPTARRRGGSAAPSPADSASAAPAVTVPVTPDAKIEPNYKYSVTGRPLHTPLYDLVQFNVNLRCEADQVPYVLKQLQKDSLLTVLNVDVTNVDLAVAAMDGYIYGRKPVVQLDLQCEMAFLRPWLAPLMPTQVAQAVIAWGGDADATPAP